MATVELTDKELRIISAALAYVRSEIDDDMDFETRIGSARWEAEELRKKLSSKGASK